MAGSRRTRKASTAAKPAKQDNTHPDAPAIHPAFARLSSLLVKHRGWDRVEFSVGPREAEPHVRIIIPSPRRAESRRLVASLPRRMHGLRIEQGKYATEVMLQSGAAPTTAVPTALQPGYQISRQFKNSAKPVGTCGMLLRQLSTGRRFLLSNGHVLFGGFDPRPGDPVVQPPLDSRIIGTLATLVNVDVAGVDMATAELMDHVPVDPKQRLANTMISTIRRPDIASGEIVYKAGARTGVTFGRICSYSELRQRFGLGPPRGPLAFGILPLLDGSGLFSGQELSMSEDSGSVWIARSDNAAVGLHVGGDVDSDQNREYAVACEIKHDLDEMGLVPLVN